MHARFGCGCRVEGGSGWVGVGGQEVRKVFFRFPVVMETHRMGSSGGALSVLPLGGHRVRSSAQTGVEIMSRVLKK